VPGETQGSNKALHDGPLAAVTLGGKLLIVIFPAVCLPILLMETLITKVLTTQRTEEMLWMPCLAKSIHASLKKKNTQ